ncbi:MAG TPA: hypothetical protein VFU02_16425 [Polyangiaceae bacterium]|nr:hypothetical protein [Polyangiaceae bacterium]
MKDSNDGAHRVSPLLVALGVVALLLGLAAGVYMSLIGARP